VRQRYYRRVAIVRGFPDGVIGHITNLFDTRDRETIQNISSRITDHDAIVERLCHFGHILRNHTRSYKKQLVARTIRLHECLGIFLVTKFLKPINVERCNRAIAKVYRPLTKIARLKTLLNLLKMRQHWRFQRLNDNVEVAATRQAKLFSFFFVIAVSEKLCAFVS
jgi:hypothetical protein